MNIVCAVSQLTRDPTNSSPREAKDSRMYDTTTLPTVVRLCGTTE